MKLTGMRDFEKHNKQTWRDAIIDLIKSSSFRILAIKHTSIEINFYSTVIAKIETKENNRNKSIAKS
jgi:hypothetical protein